MANTYYYFQSGSDERQFGFTDNPAGHKLPSEHAPWSLVREVDHDHWHHAADRGVVGTGVSQNGFYLWEETAPSPHPVIESDRVEGTRVFDRDGNHIGTIKRLLIEKVNGRVLYVDMAFGGFLGLGAQHHTIPWEKLSYDTRLGGYRTDVTEEQVRGAPSFYTEEQLWPDRKQEEKSLDYWRSSQGL